jgi:sterol desaturase/sphingolipid hydroxylase (fatty acid hydroxylase superfamily)
MEHLLLYGIIGLLFGAERLLAHDHRTSAGTRWLTNVALFLLTGATVGLILPGGLEALAAGALPDSAWQFAIEVAAIILLRDFVSYWEHRLMHQVPLLWRVHRVHHSDASVDVTTAHRHHPFEVIISSGVAALVVLGLGFSAAALAVALIVAGLASVYTHTSLRLPEKLDRSLRLALMTPSVHRVHHSAWQPQTDSNYATVLTCWDRLFGTYRDPADNPVAHVGLEGLGEDEETLLASLTLPLRSPAPAPIETVPTADRAL